MSSQRFLKNLVFRPCVFLCKKHNYVSPRNPPQWRLNPSAALHTASSLSAKLFVDRENQFAHEVLQQSLKPYQLLRLDADKSLATAEQNVTAEPPAAVLRPPDSSSAVTVDELFSHFCALTQFCTQTGTCISEERFRDFMEIFCEATRKLSNDQLVETLRQMVRLPPAESVKSPNFVELWNTLDIECCRRLEEWNSDELLLICDAWYSLHLARICEFLTEALRKLGRKVKSMRPEQLVQMMFLCNVVRRPVCEMFEFEVNLARCVDTMSLQELGVMSMGFFKTQTPIRNPDLIEHLYRRLTAELDTVEDITLVAILKVLRYSTRLPQVNLIEELLKALYNQVGRISLVSCLHVALLGSDLQICNDAVMERILQRFNRDLSQARIKDLERICLAIAVFNTKSVSGVEQELCANILLALQTKIDEVLKYPRCFTSCLHFLTLKGYHNPEMISTALGTDFIRHAYGKNMVMGREIFYLDSYVKINLKDSGYKGNQLPEKNRRTMGKLLTHYIPVRDTKFKLNTTDRIALEIKECIDRILRHTTVFKHILPHFERPDVVICYDRTKRKVLPLSPACPEDYSGTILTRETLLGDMHAANIDTVAIVVAGWNNIVRGKNRHTALFDMKLKQLELLGHKRILIYWHEWRELETPADKQKFLRRKFAAATN